MTTEKGCQAWMCPYVGVGWVRTGLRSVGCGSVVPVTTVRRPRWTPVNAWRHSNLWQTN